MTPFLRAVIVGTGAVGGSVGGALRARGLAAEVVGVDPAHAESARALGWIDRVETDLARAVEGAQWVVLAAPVPVNCALLADPALREALAPEAVITDVSSTKRSVVEAAAQGLGARRGRFVASHPIAGSDRAGPSASRADLLTDAHVIVCPTDDCDADAVRFNEAVWSALGARVASMTPDHHDRLFAEVSHWPHAVAFALTASIARGPLAQDAQRYHGAGLRDTTRVGGSPPDLWAGILLDNREAVGAAAAAFRVELDRIEAALAAGDREALTEALACGARWRAAL